MPHPIPESGFAMVAAQLTVGASAAAVSIPPLFCKSTPEKIHPLRVMDIAGIPDFFDHSGNCINGSLAAGVIITAGLIVETLVPEEKRTVVVLGAAGLAAAGSVGVNMAYESGVYIPPVPQKPNSELDMQDALFGGVTGILFSTVFAVVALRKKFTK